MTQTNTDNVQSFVGEDGELRAGLFCPACGHINADDALTCTACDEPFPEPVPDLSGRLIRIAYYANRSRSNAPLPDDDLRHYDLMARPINPRLALLICALVIVLFALILVITLRSRGINLNLPIFN